MSAEAQRSGPLQGSAIILVRPKYPENIGASARIALNFGIDQVIVVSDEAPDQERMLKMATHKAAHLIDNLEIYPTIEEALAPFSIIVGTTARRGRQRCVEQTPREMVDKLIPQLPNNQVAIVFGPEDTGLTLCGRLKKLTVITSLLLIRIGGHDENQRQ